MTEQFTLIERRLISGKGIIRIPQGSEWRYFVLYIDVVRFPFQPSVNFRWNPNRSEYAKMTWMAGDYVYREETIRYLYQVFDYYPHEPNAYIGSAIACMFEALQAKLVNIGIAVGLPAGVPGDPIPIEPVKNLVDTLRFVCFDSTALQLSLYGLELDVACPSAAPSPKEVPPIPDSLPILPSGDAIGVTPPYEEPDDDGNTQAFEGDEIDNEDCAGVGWWRWRLTTSPEGVTFFKFKGRVTDVCEVRSAVTSSCPAGTDLYVNDILVYMSVTCFSTYISSTFTWSPLTSDPGGSELPVLFSQCT